MPYKQLEFILHKTCVRCKQTRPFTEFFNDVRSKDGKRSRCHICLSIDTSKYRQEKPEIYSAAARRRRKNDPEKHRLIGRIAASKRRSIIKGSIEHFRKVDIDILRKKLGFRCKWCNRKILKFHIDHIIPLSKGGTNGPSNITIACPSCNVRKGSMLPTEWQAYSKL